MRFFTIILLGFMAVSTTQASASSFAPATEVLSESSTTVAPMIQGNEYGRCVAQANMEKGQGYAHAASQLAILTARGQHSRGRSLFNRIRIVTDIRFSHRMRRCERLKARR